MNNSNDDPYFADPVTTTLQGSGEYTLYTINKFTTQQEAEAACKILQEAGFSAERLSIKPETINPAHEMAKSQVSEGAKGGALVGATFGGLVGCSSILLANNLPGSVFNPTFSPWLGLIAGAIVGAMGLGLIGALTGRNVPQTKPGTEGAALTSEYRVMLAGTRKDVSRSSEILRQQNI